MEHNFDLVLANFFYFHKIITRGTPSAVLVFELTGILSRFSILNTMTKDHKLDLCSLVIGVPTASLRTRS